MIRRIALSLLCAGILSAAQNPKAEKEVMAAMNAFKDALIKKDVAAMDKIVHAELQYSHSNGVLTQDKKVWLEYLAKEANTVYLDWGNQRIRVYGNVAVATGDVDIRGGDGKTPFLVKMINVWAKEGGRWQLISRQATRVTPPGSQPGRGRGQQKQ